MKLQTFLLFLAKLSMFEFVLSKKRPNVLYIMADDYGWNDVSWHNKKIPTPNIEDLAMNGVILNQSYTNMLCTA